MAQAEPTNTTNLSRRRILLTAPAAACAIRQATASHPDAGLIELGRRLRAAWAAEKATYVKWGDLTVPEADREITAAFDSVLAIVDQIERIPATTLEGVRVKALAVWWCCSGEPFDDGTFSFNGSPTTDARLASAIMRDLLAMSDEAVS